LTPDATSASVRVVLDLTGRIALVTGAGRGIGAATAVLFGRLGARVAINYRRDAAAAESTARAVRAAGSVATVLRADLSRPGEAERLVAETEQALGPLDTLVVNQGIWKRASLVDMTPEKWDETLGVNLDGAYAVCRAAAQRMLTRKRGTIVTIASTAGQRGEAHYSHYAASKGALIAFTKSLAAELGPGGIRVNGVAPGWVLTDMSREALEGASGGEDLAKIPLGRAGTPEEIAGPVAFLASDLASYLFGEILCVNGGAVMMG
jgi:3-oxoacyl-[acyl-carrier protein] reductase